MHEGSLEMSLEGLGGEVPHVLLCVAGYWGQRVRTRGIALRLRTRQAGFTLARNSRWAGKRLPASGTVLMYDIWETESLETVSAGPALHSLVLA